MTQQPIDDGGQAFPYQTGIEAKYPGETIPGISLRDWFAGKALVGLFAQSAHPQSPGISSDHYAAAAVECYRIADAMLAARKETRP